MGTSSQNAKPDIEIVGLVQDTRCSEVKRTITSRSSSCPTSKRSGWGTGYFYIRPATPAGADAQHDPGRHAQVDASLPLGDIKTMEQQVRVNVSEDRIITTLSLAFALLATVLAAIGLYGVLAYTVAQRTREFGLRMALGTDGGTVRGIVMKQVGRMAIVGGLIGLAVAVAVGRLRSRCCSRSRGTIRWC